MKLNTLWVGGGLGYLERACLASAIAVGHEVDLYTYRDVSDVPKGVNVLEARSILTEDRMIRYKSNGSFALGSNIFRYELLRRNLGCWIDTDVYFVRHIDLIESSHVFGWEDERYICSAILYIPKESQLLADLLTFVNSDIIVPPWWPDERQQKQHQLASQGRALTLKEMPWATAGPKALTYFANKNNLLGQAAEREVFYPVPWTNADDLFSTNANVWRRITHKTRTVHLWNHIIEKKKGAVPNPSSFIADICRLQGIDC